MSILKNKAASHPLFIILSDIALVLMFFKCIHFYTSLKSIVGGYALPLTCLTVLILGIIYCAILFFSPRAATVTLITLYFIVSIIMSVDLVYFSYMGKLPSVGLLKMAWQLGGVGGTLKELIGFRQILPLLDLPLWIGGSIASAAVKKRISLKKLHLPHFVYSLGIPVICVILILGSMLFGGFKVRFIQNELLITHVKDIVAVLSPGDSVDKDGLNYSSGISENSPFYGIAKDRNLFIIQVEALQNFVINEDFEGTELTPVMNSLIKKDSFYFENYYYQIGGGNTADAEFAVNNSMYPAGDGASYEKYTDNDFYGLPWLLKDKGYTNLVFHANRGDYWSREAAYPGQGFDNFISIEDMKFYPNEGCVFAYNGNEANTDRRLFADVVNTVKASEGPVYAFTITLSSHHPFAVAPADRYVDSDNPSPNLFTLYIQSIAYVDRVIGEFMDQLKKEGLYDNSMFVIYGDHYAISQSDEKYTPDIEKMTGEEYDIFDRFNVPLIIHIPGLGTERTIDTVGAHVDVMPTVLNLLGIQNDSSLMFGHNLLDPEYEGIVYEIAHVKEGSFITKDIFYVHSAGGINSKVYTKDGDELEVTDEHLEVVDDALKAINDCHSLLDSNSILIEKKAE